MINPHDVLSAIADWLRAKELHKEEPEPTHYGAFGFSLSGDRDDGDEEKCIPEVEDKYLRAQAALEAYVDLRVQRALEKLINDSQRAQERPPGFHELYPEKE